MVGVIDGVGDGYAAQASVQVAYSIELYKIKSVPAVSKLNGKILSKFDGVID